MDKVQAEEIINSAFNALLEKLQAQDEYNPQLLIDDLHSLAKTLKTDSNIPLNLHSPEQTYELEYKNIAQESLLSYAHTQESVERINQEQQKLIEECKLKISKEYFPVNGRKAKCRRSVAQKFIKHFMTLGVENSLIIDVMLFNIDMYR